MKCKGCDQERNELKDGLCILCIRGPGGKPVEIKEGEPRIKYRGKVIKTNSPGFSTRNRGVWKKEKSSNI